MKELQLKDRTGVVVVDTAPGGPAHDAGIQPGDVIKEVNRKPVRSLKDYDSLMGKTEKGKPVLFLIKRGGQTFYVSIKVS